ncbi:MAG: hypothetical protein JRF69_11295 [Deltaproteobacteria bacterium]|nr:hypothetical protein [Deltaproteobacteria bacterium]MBW2259158.1 hypothetical protein [Deltaproteobacteria bacterium]
MGPDNGVENGVENGFENGFDIQDVGMVAGFLCTEEEAEEEAKKVKSPEEDLMDASAIGLDMADVGLDMSSFDEEEEDE